MRIPTFFTALLISVTSLAQQLGAFTDFEKKFFIFDQGTFRQLEFQPVKSFGIGDHCVAYVTDGDYLKAYANHLSYDVSPAVTSYIVTNQIVCFQIGTQLYSFENGQKNLLSKFVGKYQANDSLIAFFDTGNRYFLVYYHYNTYQLEDGIIYRDDQLFKTGTNILAYVDAFQNFKVFYRGKVSDLFKITQTLNIEAGRNILAFVDPGTEKFQAFYNGDIIDLEQFAPKSFQAGYEKIAYVDQMDNFKIFDNGNQVDLGSYAPDVYLLKDNILMYALQNHTYVYMNGETYPIENYIPVDYQVDGSRMAYIDQNGHLALFENGEKQILSYEAIKQYNLSGEVVIFTEGVNTVKVYYQQKTYTR
jgi:hypothetical protein